MQTNHEHVPHTKSPAEVADALRGHLGQEILVFNVRDAQTLHAGANDFGENIGRAALAGADAGDDQVRVVRLHDPLACLVIPLNATGHAGAAGVAVFRTRDTATEAGISALAKRFAADPHSLRTWLDKQPVCGEPALQCLGALAQEKLAAELKFAQLGFEAKQLGDKIGETFEEISLLYEVVENVREANGPEELAQFVLDWAVSLLPAEQAVAQVFANQSTDPVADATFLSVGDDILDNATFTRLMEHTRPDVEGRPLVMNAESTQADGWPFPSVREFIAVPLRAERHNAGWLAVINHADGGWLGTHEARLLSAAATMMGMRVMMNEMVELRKAAETASADKSRFLANISHEFRTPLNGILSFSRMLKDGDEDEAERRDSLEMIDSCAGRLYELVDDVVEFSKLQSSHVDVQRIPCRLDEIVMSVASKNAERAAAKGLTLDAAGVAGTMTVVYTDPTRMTQLLTILVRNAIKFTKRGGIQIVVHLADGPRSNGTAAASTRSNKPAAESDRLLRSLSEEFDSPAVPADTLVIDVVDTGVGIAPERMERIFEPFVQGDDSRTREFGGLGLGLTICRRLVDALGGFLTVRSKVGKGSTFRVHLPASLLAESQRQANACRSRGSTESNELAACGADNE